MLNNKAFQNKKILLYGFGISGKSCFNYLKKNNNVETKNGQKEQQYVRKISKLLIKGDYWGDIQLLFDNDVGRDNLHTKIILHINTPPSLEEMIKLFHNNIAILNKPEIEIYNKQMSKHADIADKALKALSVALLITEFADTTVQSTNLQFIGLATLGFSVAMRSIAIVFETELQIKSAIENIHNLWEYIIEPLNKISTLENKDENEKNSKLLHKNKMEKLIDDLNEKMAILLKNILIYNVKNRKEITRAEDKYTGIQKWNNSDNYLRKKSVPTAMTKKLENPITRSTSRAVSFVGKTYRANNFKTELEEACNDIEEQLKLIMQVMNLKTNFNTLKLLEKVANIEQFTGETTKRFERRANQAEAEATAATKALKKAKAKAETEAGWTINKIQTMVSQN